MSLRTANVYIYIYIYIFSFTDFLSWYMFNYDAHVVVWLDISITTLQVLLTYANVCSLFILQFCSVLHFRRSIAFGFAFSTPYTLVPRFPPLHFWRCRVFRSRIFSRPVKSKGRPKWIYTPWAIKTCHSIFVHNFEKYRPILKILSLLDSAVNSQQGIFHRDLCVITLPCETQKVILLMYLSQYHRFASKH